MLTYDRFTIINSNLSLSSVCKNDNSGGRDIDKDTKKIFDYLNAKFKQLYTPSQALSIDEGMCKYQGRYSFKTYMPAKPIKVGMKFYIMADSKTSFVTKIKLYTGKYSSIKETVKDLIVDVKSFNHTLYMDNYYNSIALCEELREDKIFC